uniref:Uncharacterized protein n=1 Tax=Setaria italica TaxID=4555 RepID=K3Z193_SETIT
MCGRRSRFWMQLMQNTLRHPLKCMVLCNRLWD